MKLAVIADIHSNIWALEAVLEDIATRGVDQTVNLGDSLYGSIAPAAVADRLLGDNIPSIAGNQERDLIAPSPEVAASAEFGFIRAQLKPSHIAWLHSQPKTLIVGEVFCCHGTPSSDETYLLETVSQQGVNLADGQTIERRLGNVVQPVVVCGHSHVPRTVWLPGGQLVVNPGSAGHPAYSHDTPYPHTMESGSPHARYAIVEQRKHGWQVEQVAVPYDWDRAARVSEQNGRPHRSSWLRTGRA
jgi:predicted phosphodiesterase